MDERGWAELVEKYINNIEWWLKRRLAERGITTHKFAQKAGLTSATIYRWYAGQYQPTAKNMSQVCEALSRIPVVLKSGEKRLQHVPAEEGMRQYSPESGKQG